MGVLQDGADLVQKGPDVVLGRLDQEFASVFPDMLARKVEPFPDRHDTRLLLRENQTAFPQECFHNGFDFVLKELFRAPGDNEFVGIFHNMDLTTGVKAILENPFQSVEYHIGHGWRSNSPLRGSFHGGKEGSFVGVPRPQSLTEHDLVRRDVVEQPWVTDRVETALDVAFQNPLGRCLSGQ